MHRLGSGEASMSKRAETLSRASRDLSALQGKMNLSQRAFEQYSGRLEKLSNLLKNEEENRQSVGFLGIKRQLEEELSSQEELVKGYSGRSALYLLMCSPRIVSELQESGKRLKKGLEVLCDCNLVTEEFLEEQFGGEFVKPSSEDEALMDSLEEGMLDTIVIDSGLCTALAKQIADSVGLEMGSQGFSSEIEKLRNEKSAAEAQGGKVHALYLEQFLLVLDRAVQFASRNASEEEAEGQNRKSKEMMASISMSGRDAPMLPLQPFICPITRDVMRDPVQIASGQTYEREAIERWFAEGNTRCPVMGEELSTTQMKSNFALKQSIAEWRERNYEARLHGVARYLLAVPHGEAEVKLRMVREVRTVCEQEPLNKYKVGAMGLIAPMVKLVESRDSKVREETLAALVVLARDNLENQETMVKEGIIEFLVYSLTRQKEDLQKAVLLMKILSEHPNTAELISHAQGAVVFLVTLLGCEDEDLNQSVKAILENVPTSDENVVIMAEANFMRPLAIRIVEGSVESRIVMAKALAGMHLPVASKTSVATEDVIQSLLKMIEGNASEEASEAALGALRNLTSVPSIAETVMNLHGFKHLEQKLSSVKTPDRFKVAAAKILADVSSVAGDVWEQNESSLSVLEIYIYKFLKLMESFTPAAVQGHVLRSLLGLANGKSVGRFTIEKLGEHKAMEILLPFLTRATAPEIRKHAMELFCVLSKQFSRDAGRAMMQKPEVTSELLKNLTDDPERSSLLGIIASVEDGETVIKNEVRENESFVMVVTGLLTESSHGGATVEAALGIVLKLAKLGVEIQKKMAEAGLVGKLVQLLEPGRSRITRCRSAWILAEMSSNSRDLSSPPKKKSTSSFLLLCMPWMVQRGTTHRLCRVHKGQCTARQSFCLLEADAVAPLVALLKEAVSWKDDVEGAAAPLAALATLTGTSDDVSDDSSSSYDGCVAIDKAKGLGAVIGAVSSGGPDAQRYALGIVEALFGDSDYVAQYGASAQMHVIYAAQTGNLKCRRIAGRILRRLELIHSQSNYLGTG